MPDRNEKPKVDRRKVSLDLTAPILREVKSEAKRQHRSLSWIVQAAWKLAREKIQKYRPPLSVISTAEGEASAGKQPTGR